MRKLKNGFNYSKTESGVNKSCEKLCECESSLRIAWSRMVVAYPIIYKHTSMKAIGLYLLIFFLNSLNIKSQQLYSIEKLPKGKYSGYVVTTNLDTIVGEIIIPTSFISLCKKVEFTDGENKTRTYYPDELLSFHFENIHFIGNTRVFAGFFPTYRPAFVQQLVDGYLNYYRYLYLEFVFYGPIIIPKLSEDLYYSYGHITPNNVGLFKELLAVTWDRRETYDTIFNRQFARDDIPGILYNYNCWVSKSGKLIEKIHFDSMYASTKLDLEEACKDSLLVYRSSDKNFYEYIHRIIYYAQNTPDYIGYTVVENKDDIGRTLLCGVRVSANNKYMKIGTWKYFHESDNSKGDLQLKKEETYDYNGLLHGTITSYNENGEITGTEIYSYGKKLEKQEQPQSTPSE